MPNELIVSLRQDLNKIPSLIRRAEVASIKRDKLGLQYNNLENDLKEIKSKKAGITEDNALEKTIAEAPKILWREAKLAVKINTEFNNEIFLRPLKTAIDNSQTYTIIPFKNGTIKVKFNLNETAGSLSDYGNAIKKIRETLGTKSGAEIASHFWSEKFYGAAREGKPALVKRGKGKDRKTVDQSGKFARKYWNTMRQRMSVAGKLAPWWQILDKGEMPIPSAHRKGGEGTAYPSNSTTEFTNKAQLAIKEFYLNQISKVKTTTKIDTTTIDKLMVEIKEAIKYIDSIIRDINKKALDPSAELLTRVEKYMDRVNETKLERLLLALKSKDFTNIRVTAAGRIEMTKPGEERYRPYISSMLEYYGIK